MSQTPNPYPFAQPLAYDASGYLFARDVGHLNLLGVFHYVYGAITCAISCVFIIHIVLGVAFLSGKMNGQSPPPPDFLGWVFVGMGATALVLGWTIGLLTIYCGRCLRTRRRWTFTIVISAINCLSFPLGTALGVFTIVVLVKDSVKVLYGQVAGTQVR